MPEIDFRTWKPRLKALREAVNVPAIASAARVSEAQLWKIMRGDVERPHALTLEAVEAEIRRLEIVIQPNNGDGNE